MSTTSNSEGSNKIHEMVEKFGGWTAAILLALVCYMYQGDRANTAQAIAGLEKNIEANQLSIGRLQEGKMSREEFKSVQDQWIRETVGIRQDIRDLTIALRIDVTGTAKNKQ